jgi:hypothetical protein
MQIAMHVKKWGHDSVGDTKLFLVLLRWPRLLFFDLCMTLATEKEDLTPSLQADSFPAPHRRNPDIFRDSRPKPPSENPGHFDCRGCSRSVAPRNLAGRPPALGSLRQTTIFQLEPLVQTLYHSSLSRNVNLHIDPTGYSCCIRALIVPIR